MQTDQELMERIQKNIGWLKQQNSLFYKALPVDFHACNANEGWIELRHKTGSLTQNPHGTLHGGAAAWLLDTTMAIAGRSFSGAPSTPTLDLHINFLKGINVGRELSIRAEVKRMGRRIISLYGEIRDIKSCELYVTATANSYIPSSGV